ncbi:MAG: hypothetical protein GXO63_00025 [Candidatus Micrarchaeota archaeon]|nr:hypothetical protein [Candidatus Micrarchaeota archaeon]
MVWARTKLVIQDDLLKPVNVIEINFTGPNPQKFYHEIPKLLISIFRLSESDIQERKISWVQGDPEKFKVLWEAYKELDGLSYYFITVELSGEASKGTGRAKITVEGFLRTEYPQDTIWQRSLFYEVLRIIWHKTVYHGKRMEYLEEGKKLLARFIEELKNIARGSVNE